ncbi:MAG: hypothetical protein LAO30_04545 [Acidobacteriia bacterium]|nr:hypothetical protein [Terriglobia bacterium]
MRVARGQPRITDSVEAMDEKGAALLRRLHGNGRIPGAPFEATKGRSVVRIGFGSDQFSVGRATPEISAAGLEEGAGKRAKGPDELRGIAVMKSGSGKFKEKLLERLVRLRRVDRSRVSGVGGQ